MFVPAEAQPAKVGRAQSFKDAYDIRIAVDGNGHLRVGYTASIIPAFRRCLRMASAASSALRRVVSILISGDSGSS